MFGLMYFTLPVKTLVAVRRHGEVHGHVLLDGGDVRLGHGELEAQRVGRVDARDARARLHVLAHVDVPLADDAVERRADVRVARAA